MVTARADVDARWPLVFLAIAVAGLVAWGPATPDAGPRPSADDSASQDAAANPVDYLERVDQALGHTATLLKRMADGIERTDAPSIETAAQTYHNATLWIHDEAPPIGLEGTAQAASTMAVTWIAYAEASAECVRNATHCQTAIEAGAKASQARTATQFTLRQEFAETYAHLAPETVDSWFLEDLASILESARDDVQNITAGLGDHGFDAELMRLRQGASDLEILQPSERFEDTHTLGRHALQLVPTMSDEIRGCEAGSQASCNGARLLLRAIEQRSHDALVRGDLAFARAWGPPLSSGVSIVEALNRAYEDVLIRVKTDTHERDIELSSRAEESQTAWILCTTDMERLEVAAVAYNPDTGRVEAQRAHYFWDVPCDSTYEWRIEVDDSPGPYSLRVVPA